MTIQWSDIEVHKRLVVAIVASFDNKINISEIARLYGQDMTRDALENQMRKIKKEATAMKEEAVGREKPAAPAKGRGRGKKSVSPVKRDAVKSGRVTKTRASGRRVKSEPIVKDEDAYDEDEEEAEAIRIYEDPEEDEDEECV